MKKEASFVEILSQRSTRWKPLIFTFAFLFLGQVCTADHNEQLELEGLFYSRKEFDKIFNDLSVSVNTIWIVTASINVIAMQLGFSFLEVGWVQNKNKTNILIKNLLDIFFGALAYWSIGFAFANQSYGGVVGNGPFFCLGLDESGFVKWIFQFSQGATAATIVSGSLAERCQIDTYIIFTFLICGVIYPIAASWVWGDGWLGSLGFRDFAGAGVVSLIGGASGLVGTYFMGARIGIYEDMNEETKTRKKLQRINRQRVQHRLKQRTKKEREKRKRDAALKMVTQNDGELIETKNEMAQRQADYKETVQAQEAQIKKLKAKSKENQR